MGEEGRGRYEELQATHTQTHMQVSISVQSVYSAMEPMEGQRVDVLASFILLDWLSAAANLGFPPTRKRRGKGEGFAAGEVKLSEGGG